MQTVAVQDVVNFEPLGIYYLLSTNCADLRAHTVILCCPQPEPSVHKPQPADRSLKNSHKVSPLTYATNQIETLMKFSKRCTFLLSLWRW